MKQKIYSHLNLAERVVDLLENKFSFMGIRFGLDPILGLMPGIGDFISFLLGAYIIWIGVRMELPAAKISQMVMNSIFDLVIGAIPFLGDIGDFAFRSNSMNLKILREHADKNMEGEEGVLIA